MDRGAKPRHGRGRGRADQARLLVLAAGLLTAGCNAGQGPEALGPLWGNLTGPAFEGRDPPPGAASDFPNLGTIPPRPSVPDVAVRDALTAALAEQRQRSRNPLDAEMRPAPPRPAGTDGDRSMPMGPPGPPPLARAPRVNWDPVDPMPPAPQAPAAAPGAPDSPAAPPVMDSAPPPPPPADLLTPGGPPPPPPAELLRPR
jgi:hypothetical protein